MEGKLGDNRATFEPPQPPSHTVCEHTRDVLSELTDSCQVRPVFMLNEKSDGGEISDDDDPIGRLPHPGGIRVACDSEGEGGVLCLTIEYSGDCAVVLFHSPTRRYFIFSSGALPHVAFIGAFRDACKTAGPPGAGDEEPLSADELSNYFLGSPRSSIGHFGGAFQQHLHGFY